MRVMNTSQRPLFDGLSDAALMDSLLLMPKVDLHRHLTGSITAESAIRVAARYGLKLPTYIASELQDILFPLTKVKTLGEYFSPWQVLNRLFISRESSRDLILDAIKDAAQDNVVYVEFRVSPRGFLGDDPFSFEQFVETLSDTVAEAEDLMGVAARFILGIPRHIFGRIPIQQRNKMFTKIISIISPYRTRCFVGVDLSGDEEAIGADVRNFDFFFSMARDRGFNITIHAGELGNADDVRYSLIELGASRIGHGLAAASDPRLLEVLAERSCALEICPTSNKVLGVINGVNELPLRVLHQSGVPYVICSDNPARCRVSLSDELFKVSKSFEPSISGGSELTCSALSHSFADEELKRSLALLIHDSTDKPCALAAGAR